MKKTAFIAFAAAFVFVLTACQSAAEQSAQPAGSPVPTITAEPTAEPAQLPNPVVEVDGAADFSDLGFIITPHQQADSAVYSIIGGTLAQIVFTLDGQTFTYRAEQTTQDISGVYETFDPLPQSLDLAGPGFEVTVLVRTIDSGARGALAEWEYEDIRYSFYTPDKTDFDQLTDVLLPIIYNDLPFAACCG